VRVEHERASGGGQAQLGREARLERQRAGGEEADPARQGLERSGHAPETEAQLPRHALERESSVPAPEVAEEGSQPSPSVSQTSSFE
jgi:hypothetical protein